MKKKLLTLITIGILLSSCASGGYWTKSGSPPECRKALTELVDALTQIANEHGLRVSDKQKTALFDRFAETECKSEFNYLTFVQDRKECAISTMTLMGGNYITRHKFDKNMKLCLKSKGYYKTSQ